MPDEIIFHRRALSRAAAARESPVLVDVPVKGQRAWRFQGRPGTSTFHHFRGTTVHLQDRYAERRNRQRDRTRFMLLPAGHGPTLPPFTLLTNSQTLPSHSLAWTDRVATPRVTKMRGTASEWFGHRGSAVPGGHFQHGVTDVVGDLRVTDAELVPQQEEEQEMTPRPHSPSRHQPKPRPPLASARTVPVDLTTPPTPLAIPTRPSSLMRPPTPASPTSPMAASPVAPVHRASPRRPSSAPASSSPARPSSPRATTIGDATFDRMARESHEGRLDRGDYMHASYLDANRTLATHRSIPTAGGCSGCVQQLAAQRGIRTPRPVDWARSPRQQPAWWGWPEERQQVLTLTTPLSAR